MTQVAWIALRVEVWIAPDGTVIKSNPRIDIQAQRCGVSCDLQTAEPILLEAAERAIREYREFYKSDDPD